MLFDAPNGTNINDGCGSTHPERLAETVAAAGLEIGFAFDGDADRLIAVDERGELVDGDAVMGICALERLADGHAPEQRPGRDRHEQRRPRAGRHERREAR